MKITATKDLGAEKAKARARLDFAFVGEIQEAIGVNGPLYAVKHAAALQFISSGIPTPLVADIAEAETIVAKNVEMQQRLADIEARRQAAQAAIDTAETPASIDVALEPYLDAIKPYEISNPLYR